MFFIKTKKIFLILTFCCLYGQADTVKKVAVPYSKREYVNRRRMVALLHDKNKEGRYVSQFVTRFARDVFLLHKYLFDWDTAKVAAVIVPTVLISHHFDDKIQGSFYDGSCHKNKNQLPHWTREFARHITGPTIGLLAIQGFLSRDDDFRFTNQVMLIGVPILVFMNQFIKKMKFEICYRPWHEQFSSHKRSLGGFPSGHLSHAVYLATLYGIRYGYKFALPLGLMSTFIGVTFLSCNRHYLSQLIAGVGFGAVYGLAASKLVDYKLLHDRDINIQVAFDNGAPSLQAVWRF